MIEATQKKLREAKFFLHELNKTSQQVVRNEPEEFEFYLSAFLSSGRAVTFALQYEEKQKYDAWFPEWFNRHEEDKALAELMKNQRNFAQKRGGTETRAHGEYIPITEIRTGIRGHPAYGFHWCGPSDVPAPQVQLLVHSFEGSGEQVISTCTRYVGFLDGLVRILLRCIQLRPDRPT